MGAPKDQVSSQEAASEKASSRFSGKGLVLITLIGVIAIALTALALINNPALSTIADNPNPMASGEPEDIDAPKIYDDGGEGYYYKEPDVGSSYVEYYAMEGGTLTFDPDDDASVDKCEPVCIDENGNIVELPSSSSKVSPNAKTGLKEYKRSVAVNPTVCYGSITAVPDPGYVFVSWNNGVNYSPKLYLWGAMTGTATAYFEKLPEPIAAEDIRIEEPNVGGSQKVEYYAMEGGTITLDPNDLPADYNGIRGTKSDVQTGLKEYKTNLVVNPTICFGSITAVPDPGYSFVSWNNGENYSPKLYIWGAMRGTATAYFEKTPIASSSGPDIIAYPDSDDDGPVATKDDATTTPIFRLPNMSVYVQNALDGKVTLAQGKSTSLNGFAALSEIDYAGSVTSMVKYQSSNPAIATVDARGKITASKKKTGTAKITVFSADNPNCKKVVTVKVVKKAKYVAPKGINKVNLKKQYKANAKKQIAVKVTSWSPKAPSNKNFTVSVSPSTRASVDPATNKVTFKAKGAVKVTVKSTENPKAKITVNVKVN